MSLSLPAFADLDADTVAGFAATIGQQIGEDNARLDASRGVLGEILVFYGGILAAQFDRAAVLYENGRSLLAISENPNGVPEDAVDHVLSNFNVTRLPGRRTTGTVTVVLNVEVPTIIAAGAVFVADGQNFVTQDVYAGKPASMPLTAATDQTLRQVAPGQFAFDVPVVAEIDGATTAIRRGSLVVPEVLPPRYLTSYASADFVAGLDPETNADMLQRLQEGVAAKTPANRVCLRAMLRNAPQFARVVRTSAIGLGDRESGRDRYWLFPIAGGGRVDWYVRSADVPVRQFVTKAATVAADAYLGHPVMQVAVNRDDAPGFYELVSARRADTGTDGEPLVVLDEQRALDLSGGGYVPDVRDLTFGAYSRYQTAILQFADPAGTAGAEYLIEVSALPQIGDIQDFMANSDNNGLLSDLLVRAPVPCFVKIAVTAYVPPTATVDSAAVGNAIASAVNAAAFVGRVYGSHLLDAAYNVLSSDVRLAGLDMIGRFRYPDGRQATIRDGELLQAPDDPAACVTAKTVQFFCTAADVTVAIVPAASGAD